MAISTRWSPSPVTRPAHSPSTMARPSSWRPSSRKNSIVAGRSSTTMPTLSIRLRATDPIYLAEIAQGGPGSVQWFAEIGADQNRSPLVQVVDRVWDGHGTGLRDAPTEEAQVAGYVADRND